MDNNYTTIKIRKSTVEKLKDIGKKRETYDDIINNLLGDINE